jgi:hypothetical protein
MGSAGLKTFWEMPIPEKATITNKRSRILFIKGRINLNVITAKLYQASWE